MTLKLDNIRFGYQSGGEKAYLLNGVNFTAEKGKITALVGSNGAGKTTLFNIISGFEKRFSGSIWYNGQNISRLPSHKIARLNILRMFQSPQMMKDQTLLENIVMVAQDHCVGENPFLAPLFMNRIKKYEQEKAERAIMLLNLFFEGHPVELDKYLSKLNDSATELSLGEQRIMDFISLLMNIPNLEETEEKARQESPKPTLLLLDEPTSGINITNIETIKKVLRDLTTHNNVTVLMVSHDMGFVRDIADTCVYLDHITGTTHLVASPDEVLSNESVRKNYLGYGETVDNK